MTTGRWRDRPREPLYRTDREHLIIFAMLIPFLWSEAGLFAWGVLTGKGHQDTSTTEGAVTGLVLLVAAVLLTRVAWLFLHRPVLGRTPRVAPEPAVIAAPRQRRRYASTTPTGQDTPVPPRPQ